MSSYRRFEDTPAWRLSQDYAYAVFEVTREECFKFRGDLVNQLRRAALSVSNNIAEGFARGTTRDFINFLYIARGSCAETRSMLHFALKFPEMATCRARLETLLKDGDRLGAQLWGWIDALQNSEIDGMRGLTDERREELAREVARADAPTRMSASEFNRIAQERGIEAAERERNARMAAWIDSLASQDERLAVQAKAKGVPICEKCGAPMALRHSKTGSKFWGCTKYPSCGFTKSYQTRGIVN